MENSLSRSGPLEPVFGGKCHIAKITPYSVLLSKIATRLPLLRTCVSITPPSLSYLHLLHIDIMKNACLPWQLFCVYLAPVNMKCLCSRSRLDNRCTLSQDAVSCDFSPFRFDHPSSKMLQLSKSHRNPEQWPLLGKVFNDTTLYLKTQVECPDSRFCFKSYTESFDNFGRKLFIETRNCGTPNVCQVCL